MCLSCLNKSTFLMYKLYFYKFILFYKILFTIFVKNHKSGKFGSCSCGVIILDCCGFD